MKRLTDAKALTAGQHLRCAICDRWVGPRDRHRVTVVDAAGPTAASAEGVAQGGGLLRLACLP